MTKVLVATVKPFAPAAVNSIRKIVEKAGYEFILLEKYADQADLVKAVEDVDAMIIRSDKATREVIEAGKNLNGAKIAILGVAFLENSDDTRNTPSKPLYDKLIEKGAKPVLHDPYVRDFEIPFTDNFDEVIENLEHLYFTNLTFAQGIKRPSDKIIAIIFEVYIQAVVIGFNVLLKIFSSSIVFDHT